MKTYQYNSLGQTNPITITEKEIIELYYTYWCIQMEKAKKFDLINEENCIEDWVTVNWAWEIKE